MSKGQQITIPSEMRQSLGLKQGSKMEIEIIGKKIVIKPIIEEDLEQLLKEQKNINS